MTATLTTAISPVTVHPATSRGRGGTRRSRMSLWLAATARSRSNPIGVAIPAMMPALNSSQIGAIPPQGDTGAERDGSDERAVEERCLTDLDRQATSPLHLAPGDVRCRGDQNRQGHDSGGEQPQANKPPASDPATGRRAWAAVFACKWCTPRVAPVATKS
jgi:hypothetical protein